MMVKATFSKAFGGYFKAQLKIMVVILAIVFAGLLIMRVRYSFLLAFAIAFLDMLPVFGTGTIMWPWMVIELVDGNFPRLIGLLVIYIICQVVRQVLQPKMVGDSIGMNPLLTLLFMFIGYRVGGMLGLIIGIPVGMVIMNFYEAGIFDDIIADIRTVVDDINKFRSGRKEEPAEELTEGSKEGKDK